MSLAIGHFAFGVGATTGVTLITGLNRKIKNTRLIRIAGGIWAMLPDIGKLIPDFYQLHLHRWWGNIFWFHPLLDKVDVKDSYWASAGMLMFMLIMVLVYWVKNRK